MADLTGELLQAVVAATPERKEQALKILRGEATHPAARPLVGPLLLGIGAGAKLLGVSRATFWRAMRAGKIERVELFPGSFRVRREDVELLASRAAAKRDRKLVKA
jgi:predicted DNA-binding transcriptional regulator AlpA